MTDSQKLDLLLSEMKEVKTTVSILDGRIDNLTQVAEEHFSRTRNLHEAINPNSDIEMLALRVGMLESDMRKVKAKLA